MSSLLIVIVILAIIIFFMVYKKLEPFHYIGSKIHIRLDKDYSPLYFSYQMPSGNGEYGCTQVPCPKFTGCYADLNKYDNTHVCWDCSNFH